MIVNGGCSGDIGTMNDDCGPSHLTQLDPFGNTVSYHVMVSKKFWFDLVFFLTVATECLFVKYTGESSSISSRVWHDSSIL